MSGGGRTRSILEGRVQTAVPFGSCLKPNPINPARPNLSLSLRAHRLSKSTWRQVRRRARARAFMRRMKSEREPTLLDVPDDFAAMNEEEQEAMLEGMIDQLVAEQELEVVED